MSTAVLSALEHSHSSLRHALLSGDAVAIADAALRLSETTARIADDDWSTESRDQMVNRIARLRADFAVSRGMLNALGDSLACRQTVVAALRGDGMATPIHC